MRRKIITLVVIALWLPATLSCVCLNVRRLVDILRCRHIEALNEDTLNRLELSPGWAGPISMQPGETTTFYVGVVECCYVFRPVVACTTWSVNPPEGASIDRYTGVFVVDPTTPSGSVFTVSANVENGRRVVSTEVHVFTPQANPFVGFWGEEAQFACGTEEEVVPEKRIMELHFRANGTFSVTWTPFEVYKDYWGTYTYDLEKGSLELVATDGNYIPDDMDGSGSFSFEQGRLILRDIWLGRPRDGRGLANCGHRFKRR